MIADQQWDTAAHVGSHVVVPRAGPRRPEEPVVVNVNVPNLPIDGLRGWRHAEIGLLPPRPGARPRLDPIAGREGVFPVSTWSGGTPVELPADTDGGAIERDEVTVTYVSRLLAEPRPELAAVDRARRPAGGAGLPTMGCDDR